MKTKLHELMHKRLAALREVDPTAYAQLSLCKFVPSYAQEDANSDWWRSQEAKEKLFELEEALDMLPYATPWQIERSNGKGSYRRVNGYCWVHNGCMQYPTSTLAELRAEAKKMGLNLPKKFEVWR